MTAVSWASATPGVWTTSVLSAELVDSWQPRMTKGYWNLENITPGPSGPGGTGPLGENEVLADGGTHCRLWGAGWVGLLLLPHVAMLWDDGQLWCAWLLPHLDLLTVADPVPLTQRSPDCLL